MRLTNSMEIVENCQDCKMKSNHFFCSLSTATLKAFQEVKFAMLYPRGTVLFSEEEAARGVFMLCKGRVKVSIASADGKTLILRIAHPGELLGLHAVVSGKPYMATAEALEPCQIDFVKSADFTRFMRERGDAALRVAQQLSANYQSACDQARTLGLNNSMPQKMARFLLQLSGNGSNSATSSRVKLTLTQEEIGQMIGASRETVSRTLAEFKGQQLAIVRGATLVIPNRSMLESMAA